jgi:hypothetical protein
MLVELSVVEQRYHAVLEVLVSRVPVTEVAERYGVSRKSVHAWLRRYQEFGLAGLLSLAASWVTERVPTARSSCGWGDRVPPAAGLRDLWATPHRAGAGSFGVRCSRTACD